MVCCNVAKAFSAALMLSQSAAGVIAGLHRLVIAYVRTHDDADNLSAIALCTSLSSCCIVLVLACTMGTLAFDNKLETKGPTGSAVALTKSSYQVSSSKLLKLCCITATHCQSSQQALLQCQSHYVHLKLAHFMSCVPRFL
jgi:hypothetical protein